MIETGVLSPVAFVAFALAATLGWLAWRAARIAATEPDRLVAELRLAQFSAIVLALVAGSFIGLAVGHQTAASAGLEVAMALGFFAVAAVAPLRDPREALTALALAFLAHAVLDILHRPGFLSAGLAPGWYVVGCAVLNVYAGAVSFLPLLRR